MNANITASAVAEGQDRVWDEFLKMYFDDKNHMVCGETVAFPLAVMSYGAGDIASPVGGLGITVVQENGWGARGKEWLKGSGGKAVLDEVAWWVYFRAKVGPAGAAAGLGNARHLARRGYDLFCSLIRDPDTSHQLGLGGIHDLELGQGRPEEALDYATWIVRVRGRVGFEW